LQTVSNDDTITTEGVDMNVLPNATEARIPIEKLLNYALDFEKDPNKATAFRIALGYTKRNADALIANIYRNIEKYNAIHKGNNGYGEIYEAVMNLTGENGKTANVLTSWIVENGLDFPRLTNVYVTKKKVWGDYGEA
jgi:hypothetical protein